VDGHQNQTADFDANYANEREFQLAELALISEKERFKLPFWAKLPVATGGLSAILYVPFV
jgi:hypothetical protein